MRELGFDFFNVFRDFFAEIEFFGNDFSVFSERML
jgi:hypothetical protein